jgi:Sushi repeat (SCR repeat)
MHRFNVRNSSAARALCLSLLTLLAACEADTLCPEGFRKSGALCLEEDDGNNAIAGGYDASRADPEVTSDASTSTTSDSGSADAAPDTVSALDAAAGDAASASDAGSSLDANTTTSDAALPVADAATEPTPECDAVHACGSTGYTCISNKCVSACAQTRCDANATCALVRGAPVCSCNRGYLPMGSGSALTCARDVGCEELGCDVNATCEVGTDRLRHCVCKTDYTGNGKTCTRISCPALSTLPPVENGRITTSDGTTSVGKVATVTCISDRYKITEGGQLFCDETGKWVGTIAKCSLITCPTPTASVEHAALTTPTQPSYRPGERATYTCAPGFKPRGDNGVTCGNNGTWSTPTLMCVAACGDGSVDPGEDCDPPANGLSAWTCGKECKFCPGGLCKPACTTATSCPQSPSNLSAQCVSGECVLSQCSTANPLRDPCPAGMCVASDDGTRCVPTSGS